MKLYYAPKRGKELFKEKHGYYPQTYKEHVEANRLALENPSAPGKITAGAGSIFFGLSTVFTVLIGISFMIIGFFLTLTIVGAIIGIPLMIFGGIILSGAFVGGSITAALGHHAFKKQVKKQNSGDKMSQ